MTVTEARAIAREYIEAKDALHAAMARHEAAYRAWVSMPLTFDPEEAA